MLAHLYYYAKAYYAALATGVLYLTTVIGPDIQFSDLGHVSLLHWIGFAGSVLGVGAGVAVVTNGSKPEPAPRETPAVPDVSAPGIMPGSTVDLKTAAVLDHTVPVVTAPADPATVEAPAPATDPTTPAAQ